MISSVNVYLCYQCQKCTNGCPVADMMDITPSQIIHLAQLGEKEKILNSRSIYLCVSCYSCTTRCPQKVDVAKFIEENRIIAATKTKPLIRDIFIFHKSFLDIVRRFGRLYELGLIVLLKMRTLSLKQDLVLGVKMLKKQKLQLVPQIISPREVKRIFTLVKKRER